MKYIIHFLFICLLSLISSNDISTDEISDTNTDTNLSNLPQTKSNSEELPKSKIDDSSELLLSESIISYPENIPKSIKNSDIFSTDFQEEMKLNITNISNGIIISTEYKPDNSLKIIDTDKDINYTEYPEQIYSKTSEIDEPIPEIDNKKSNGTGDQNENSNYSTNIFYSENPSLYLSDIDIIPSTEYQKEMATDIISTTNINIQFFELFIFQVQLIEKKLKVFSMVLKKIERRLNIPISIVRYKRTSNTRSLQESEEINLYSDKDIIEPNKIFALTSEEVFDNTEKIVIIQENPEYKIKLLNNDKRILDTSENKKMIDDGKMPDLSKDNGNINNYLIKSYTQGCNFNLASEKEIQESKHEITLTFLESGNRSNIINTKCTLSKEYGNKIPCLLENNIDEKYILDSYIGSIDKNFYLISPNNEDKNFGLICQINESNNNSNKKSNSLGKAAIIVIIIISILFVGGVSTIAGLFCCKKENINKGVKYGKDSSVYDSNQNIQDSYINDV